MSRRYDDHCKVENVSEYRREEPAPNDDPIDICMSKSPVCKSPSPKPERHDMHNCFTPKPADHNEGSTEMREATVSVSSRNDSISEAWVQSPQYNTRRDFEQTKDSTEIPKVSQGNGHESEQSSKCLELPKDLTPEFNSTRISCEPTPKAEMNSGTSVEGSPNTSSLQTPKEESTLDLELEGDLKNDSHHDVFFPTESTGPSIIQDSCQDGHYDQHRRYSKQTEIQHVCKRYENDGHSDKHISGNVNESKWYNMDVQELSDEVHSKQFDSCDGRMKTDPCPMRQEEDSTEVTKTLVIHCSL